MRYVLYARLATARACGIGAAAAAATRGRAERSRDCMAADKKRLRESLLKLRVDRSW